MRLFKAQITKYRSIRDTGIFDIEENKTIVVGPNEAGKSAILQALQQINPPPDVPKFDPLRDYPRSEYNEITTGKVKPSEVTVAVGWFRLEPADIALLPEPFRACTYKFGRRLDNKAWHALEGGPDTKTFSGISDDLLRLAGHADSQVKLPPAGEPVPAKPSDGLATLTKGWAPTDLITEEKAASLKKWLDSITALVDENNAKEVARLKHLREVSALAELRKQALGMLEKRLPVFVLFSNYFRVRPLIHLAHLAQRIESKVLDDEQYDYGNQCLLKLLGFTARELSNLGNAAEPDPGNPSALQNYRDQLDKRSYQLNAASVRLTNEIVSVWVPDAGRDEAARLRIVADRQYLKVVVEDELGVEIELNQRSEGFQWLVSFFVVFFAEAAEQHRNAILLLDEPGLSLHGLKQREFRHTVSKLSENNQTIYTTHSPFLVGPDELDLVRVVEMRDRKVGTRVVTTVTAGDPAGLLPLQEALGYDLAQSLFGQKKNLVLEGLTDYWYVEALSKLLEDDGREYVNERIAMVPAASAGKVVYYATILYAQKLKVAALLDSDAAGDQAAEQDNLVHTLGNKKILRTKDVYQGAVGKPEVEDLLRETLVAVGKSELGWDIEAKATAQSSRPILSIFEEDIPAFSKYRLSKAFLRWCRTHKASDLKTHEIEAAKNLVALINGALS
jgi:hypothetical protein